MTLASAITSSAAVADLVAAFAAPPTIINAAAYTVPGPGWYLIEYQGAVLTLPALTAGGPIIVTDATGAENPNIKINGTVNGDPGGLLLTAQSQSATLGAGSTSWWMQ